MTTRVVHCKQESYDVYIGRPSIWGNPYVIDQDGTREECIGWYREDLLEWLREVPGAGEKLMELKDKVLGCWCKPKSCHGDVLAELVDSLSPVDGTQDDTSPGYLYDGTRFPHTS